MAAQQQTTPKANSITPEQARDLIERSMLTGVPTAELNKYGGYDNVYKLAQQAGLKGLPRTGLIASAAPTIENTGTGNLSYAYDYSYTKHPAQITKEQFFGNTVPKQYIQYLPDYVDDYASLAALAIANDPNNRNKTFDEIDWSFLKPKLPQTPTLAEYNAVTREVNPETDTVQGQLKKILDEDDSPLMRRARAMALAQMAGRGLLNSSLAATAGYAAMIDKALPIAQQDAQTYFNQGLKNQDYQNQAELTNVNWKNEFLKSAYVTQLDFWKQSNILGLQHKNNLESMQYENKLKSDILGLEQKHKLESMQYENKLKSNLLRLEQQHNIESMRYENKLKSDILELQQKHNLESMQYENQLKSDLLRLEYGLKNDLQQAQLDADIKNTYLSVYKDLLNQLNAVLVDPNTDDATKKAMVNNYIKSIEKMRNSLRAIGQNVPDFDFSAYYVDKGSNGSSNATKTPIEDKGSNGSSNATETPIGVLLPPTDSNYPGS